VSPASTSSAASTKPHVLVVDDDKAVRESLRRSLEFNGYAVSLAADGVEALAGIGGLVPDVVVMDVMMPRLDGIETTKSLRKAGNDVPILVLTARDAVGDRVEGLDAGADDYLTKPFALAELAARVRALGRRARLPSPPVLELAGIRLDPGRRQASRDGRKLVLRGKEFLVLEELLRADGAIVSAEQLLEKAWDENIDPFTHVVRVTMVTLRRKLGDPPAIETIPGAGYRIA
jgi:DNA-binding response OmpR family regulator